MTQAEMVLELLKAGPLTPFDALREIGCFRLAARVRDLRKIGHNIVTKRIPRTSRFGRTFWYAEYYLVPTPL